MNQIVFVNPNRIGGTPFTTSDVIANCASVRHHAIQVLISKYEEDLKEFGRVSFEMRASKTKGGIQQSKIYHLNEEQSTLLLTYLKNTAPVRSFKKSLVHEFYRMRTELQRRQISKEQLKPIRRELTDIIQSNPCFNQWAYKNYTDLAYKAVTGRNAAQLRKDRGAVKKSVAIDYLTSAEIAAISKLQNQIGVLIEMGMDYQQVKMLLLNRQVIGNIA